MEINHTQTSNPTIWHLMARHSLISLKHRMTYLSVTIHPFGVKHSRWHTVQRCPLWLVTYRRWPYGFKMRLLGRGFHTLIRNTRQASLSYSLSLVVVMHTSRKEGNTHTYIYTHVHIYIYIYYKK